MIPGQTRPAQNPGRQRTGYQGVRPDDIIVGVEQPRAGSEPSAPPVARSRVSNVGEAHRRALERRQVAQQSGDTGIARRLDGTVPALERPEPPSHNGYDARDDRPRPLTGDEGVSAPRLASPPPEPPHEERQASHLSVTANIPVATESAGGSPPAGVPGRRWDAPPGMQTSPAPFEPQRVIAGQGPSDGARPPFRADAPSAMPPVAPPERAPAGPLEAEWYQAERQRHRGKRCANCPRLPGRGEWRPWLVQKSIRLSDAAIGRAKRSRLPLVHRDVVGGERPVVAGESAGSAAGTDALCRRPLGRVTRRRAP